MGVTIRDVAKAAEVSVATVSRVLNNSPSVSPNTCERVKKAMKMLDFFPNSIAKNFAQQSTFTVALIIDIDKPTSFLNPFFHEVLDGIEKVVYSQGYYLLIVNANTMVGNETALSRLILEKRVDGLILPSSILEKNLIGMMKKDEFPVVLIGEPEMKVDIDWVDINNVLAGEQAVRHLIENSYRKIAFMGGNPNDLFYKNRLAGYQSILEKSGIQYDPAIIKPGIDSKENGARLMKELLTLDKDVDSAIFNSNVTACGAVNAINESGLSIPEDFGIVCFDDYPLAEFTVPPLTTVAIDLRDLGAQAATMLLQLIEKPDSSRQHTIISTKIIARKSTARSRN